MTNVDKALSIQFCFDDILINHGCNCPMEIKMRLQSSAILFFRHEETIGG